MSCEGGRKILFFFDLFDVTALVTWQMPPASRKKKGQAPKDVDTKSSDDEGSGVRIGEGFEVEPFNGKRALKLIFIFVFIANTKQILNRLLAEAKYWMGWD